MTLEDNVKDFGITYFGLGDKRQGIVHIIGPEQGFTLPGTTVVCGDSHTSTHGAFGALAFGIGTSEVEHVLATQTLITKRSKNMRIQVDGELATGVSSKDIILHAIGQIGTAGASLNLTASSTGITSATSSTFTVSVLVTNGATLTDTASDAGSGVQSVSYYYCSGFTGSCTSSNWTPIGTSSGSSPYSVTWTGQPVDGPYEVVAVGTDNVDNSSDPSSSIPVSVNN